MLTDDTNAAADQLSQAIRGLVQAQIDVLQVAQQGNAAFVAALDALTTAVAAPRRLIEDANGNPIGVTST